MTESSWKQNATEAVLLYLSVQHKKLWGGWATKPLPLDDKAQGPGMYWWIKFRCVELASLANVG